VRCTYSLPPASSPRDFFQRLRFKNRADKIPDDFIHEYPRIYSLLCIFLKVEREQKVKERAFFVLFVKSSRELAAATLLVARRV